MSTAIAKRETTDLIDTLTTPEWPRATIEILKRQVCPKGIPDDEFYVFVKRCQTTGLNPLVGEAYCIPRYTKGPGGKHFTVHTFTPSAEGMRARAGRFPDFKKVDGAAVCELDPVALIDEGTGEVQHKVNAAKPRGRLTGAWGRVVKQDGTAVAVWLPAGSRSGNSSFWNSDPGGMLSKCAMVAALRQAYPVAFAGVYTREEMPDDSAQPSMAEQVLARADGVSTAASALAPKVEVLPPAGPTVDFGEWKGRPVSGLSLAECEAAQTFALTKMAESPKAKWVEKMRANLALIQAHAATLEPKALAQGAKAETLEVPETEVVTEPREPGMEG